MMKKKKKKKKKEEEEEKSPVCRLLNLPREWQCLSRRHIELFLFFVFFFTENRI